MGTSTDSKHARSTVAGDAQLTQSRTTSQDSLSARAFLERRMTSIEADVVEKAGQPTPPSLTKDEALLKEGLYVCNCQLQRMLTPNWLAEAPFRAKIDDKELAEMLASEPEQVEKAQAQLDSLVGEANRALKQDEIKKLGFIIAFFSKTECVQPHFKAVLQLLKNLDITLDAGTAESFTKAEGILKRGRPLIASMAESITEALEAQSPEALEAKRLNRIHQAAEKQKETFRHSDEYRALKLLALVDDRLAGGEANLSAETKSAQKLRSQGFEGVEKILLGYAPSLRIEATHLQALKELFDKVATSDTSTETANSGEGTLGGTQGSSTADSQMNGASAATQEAPETEPAQEDINVEMSPETIELKQLLLEELGISDAQEREYLAKAMTLQGIEIASQNFAGIPRYVTEKVLGCNPKLLDPTNGINLVSYCQDLKEFMGQAYDLHGIAEFDVLTTPTNFQDPSALKKTRKAAMAFRIARQKAEDSDSARG